ncbi:MAG: PAS domain S-box protein [Desulfobacteraceae bacterium]|nr:PAS domain S-box protein [Desulfobacteraceae bacterium]
MQNALMAKDISCYNFIGLLAYVRTRFGDKGVDEILAGLIDNDRYLIQDKHNPAQIGPVRKSHLIDSAYWVSNDFSIHLLRNVRRVEKGPYPLMTAGAGAFRENLSKGIMFISRIASIEFLAKKAAHINEQLNRTKTVKLTHINNDSLEFELHYKPGFKITNDVCEWNLGIYAEIVRMTGAMNVRGEEIQCLLTGSTVCKFKITWTYANVFKRIFKGIRTWLIRAQIKDLLADHEKMVKERDLLIDELTQSEKRYRGVFENTGTATAIIDQDGIISYVNQEFINLVGYKKNELERVQKWYSFIPKTDIAKISSSATSVDLLAFFRDKAREFKIVDKSGTTKYVLSKIGVIPDAKKSVLSLTDITKRKQAEEAVREKEANLSSIFRVAPIGIGVVAHNRLISVNRTIYEMLGYDQDILLNKHIRFLFNDEEEFTRTSKLLMEQIRELGTGTIETKWRRKNHRLVDIQLRITPIDHLNLSSGLTFTALDISERIVAQKEREQLGIQLRQAQKMEAIGTLAGGIAHDFNNILAAIIGYTEMTIEDLAENPAAKRRLDQVLKASFRARELVSQILTFSRQTDGEKHPVRMKPLIKEALKLLRATLPTTIEIVENLNAGFDRVYANSTQIHQVLMNLCTNAKQAMRQDGGTLTIKLENETYKTEQTIGHFHLIPRLYVRLTVADTGHGMPREIAERIFDPYFTTKGKTEGTGLGLSMVHGIAQDNGGAVSVETDLGKGTRFEVYLPVTDIKAVPDSQRPQIALTGTERILLVDDEELLASVYKDMLEGLGYHVITKTNSHDALKLFESHPDDFDLVLTDYTMPNLTGLQLAEAILKIRSDTPVILCSGYAEDITPEFVKSRGVRKMVTKPLVKNEMSAVIRRVLDESARRPDGDTAPKTPA